MLKLLPKNKLLLLQFREYLETCGHCIRTVQEYPGTVRFLLEYLETEHNITDVKEITFNVLLNYQNHLLRRTYRKRRIGERARRMHMERGKSFMRFLHKTGRIAHDPSANLPLPKVRRTPPQKLLEIKEVFRLLQEPRTATPIGIRDRAILEMLYSTGLRNTELRSLECCDVNMEERILHVQGKGGKYGLVPFGSEARAALENYILCARAILQRGIRVSMPVKAERIRAEQGKDYMFLSKSGHQMAACDLQWMVRRYSEQMGKRIHPHTLRHCCATHLLRRGADIRHIQKLLRHASINTTQIYTHVAIEDLKEAQRKYHPRERL